MIIVMPMIAVMFNSIPVSHSPANTAVVDSADVAHDDGSPQPLVEEQQQHEFGHQRRDEHFGQAHKRDLLLRVEAPQLVADTVGSVSDPPSAVFTSATAVLSNAPGAAP